MDLLKVYDCLLRDLLIAKSKAQGLNNDGLMLLLDYVSFRKARTKVDFSYSKRSNIVRQIHQGHY